NTTIAEYILLIRLSLLTTLSSLSRKESLGGQVPIKQTSLYYYTFATAVPELVRDASSNI
ncbi:MAG: hypothetical protein AABZ17_08720, partial [Nitrospirota bacterium]